MECVESERAMRGAAAREAYFCQGRVAAEALTTSAWRSWWRRLAAGHEPKCHLEFANVLAAAGSWSWKNAAAYGSRRREELTRRRGCPPLRDVVLLATRPAPSCAQGG